MTIDTRNDLFQQVAKSIAGDDPPEWLENLAIPSFVYILKGNIKVENERLGREEWRQRLQKVENSARHLLTELQDYKGFFPMLLNESGEELFFNRNEMHEGLEALAKRCKEKLAQFPETKGGKKPVAEIDE